MPEFFQYVLLALTGALLGSFANVFAFQHISGRNFRRVRSNSLVSGLRQTYMECLPLVGWWRYFWRCARGDMHLPPRHMSVELALAGIFPLAFWRLGASDFSLVVPFILLLSIIFLTDLDALIIPDRASIGGAGLGLVFAALESRVLPDLQQALVGGFCGFGLVYGINAIYRLWRGIDGIGLGDAKLMGMLGVWLGAVSLLPILFGASLAAAGLGTVLTRQKRKGSEHTQLPFGCYLVLAALVWLLFAREAFVT